MFQCFYSFYSILELALGDYTGDLQLIQQIHFFGSSALIAFSCTTSAISCASILVTRWLHGKFLRELLGASWSCTCSCEAGSRQTIEQFGRCWCATEFLTHRAMGHRLV